MSEVYRWRVADNQTQRTLGGNIMELHETGPYVLWHDYARVKAEVERIQMEQKIKAIPVEAKLIDRIAELKAEVERLTKAGDELHAFLINYIVESRISSAYLNKLDDNWYAAKEGKLQS